MPGNRVYTRDEALVLLSSRGDARQRLFREADDLRRRIFGDEVQVRGIIEFSNVCANDCLYCGIRRSNSKVRRYSLQAGEVLDIARRMPEYGQMTVVLQSGEAFSSRGDREFAELIREIKSQTPLAVTVSVGNRPRETYAAWRECGMDRYFLRFETSHPALFRRLHPDCDLHERLDCLRTLRQLGVQTGSGFMIGLPGESLETLADNILLCRELDLDMIGVGPFIPNPDTPLGVYANAYAGDPEIYFVALAVLRIFNPEAHIPATTAFDAVFPGYGRDLALQRGANVIMPNNTPTGKRKDYLLYPNKPGVDQDAAEGAHRIAERLRAMGRTVGRGRGDTRKPRTGGLT